MVLEEKSFAYPNKINGFSKKKRERNLAFAKECNEKYKRIRHCFNLQDLPRQDYYRNTLM